jgi:hypothetical protein
VEQAEKIERKEGFKAAKGWYDSAAGPTVATREHLDEWTAVTPGFPRHLKQQRRHVLMLRPAPSEHRRHVTGKCGAAQPYISKCPYHTVDWFRCPPLLLAGPFRWEGGAIGTSACGSNTSET